MMSMSVNVNIKTGHVCPVRGISYYLVSTARNVKHTTMFKTLKICPHMTLKCSEVNCKNVKSEHEECRISTRLIRGEKG